MKPDRNRIYHGDALAVLRTWPDAFIHCCITSPPYWGLRDYGADGQVGLEETPGQYIAKLLDIFREVRRVLRDDGTLWLNLGDSYNSIGGHSQPESDGRTNRIERQKMKGANVAGLKPKDMVGIPWRVALALQVDGWYLRSDIIWNKPNPMPESVQDRPTRAHEYIFLLAKSERYFYDAEAIKEKQISESDSFNGSSGAKSGADGNRNDGGRVAIEGSGLRNRRSVWAVGSDPFPGAHFATFPRALIAPCILAGTSEQGVCAGCGTPWERMVERKITKISDSPRYGGCSARNDSEDGRTTTTTTIGWQPTCEHSEAGKVKPIVLDPFMGAGTTALVAASLHRDFLGCELNPDYIKLAEDRIAGEVRQGKLW